MFQTLIVIFQVALGYVLGRLIWSWLSFVYNFLKDGLALNRVEKSPYSHAYKDLSRAIGSTFQNVKGIYIIRADNFISVYIACERLHEIKQDLEKKISAMKARYREITWDFHAVGLQEQSIPVQSKCIFNRS